MLGFPNQVTKSITADYTALIGDDAVVATAAVTSPITVTLYTAAGNFGGYSYVRQMNPGVVGGLLWVVNNGSSVVTIAANGSDSILGATRLGPGTSVMLLSDGASTWYSSVSTPSGALEIAVPISSANILGMYAAPVQVLPAPGASKVIVVDSVLTKVVTTATQYANGGVVIYQYDNTANGGGTNAVASTIPAATINAGAGTAYNLQGPAVATNGTVVVANKGIFISNQTAAFITGTGTLTATIRYRILTP